MKSFSQHEENDWSRARKRETASRHKSSDARKKAYTGLFRKVSGRTPTPGEVKASGADKGGSDYDQKNRELRRKLELTKKLNKGYENMRKGKKNPKPYPYGEEYGGLSKSEYERAKAPAPKPDAKKKKMGGVSNKQWNLQMRRRERLNPKQRVGSGMSEGYTQQSVKGMTTLDLGTFYRYAKFGTGAKRIEQGGKAGDMIKRARDLIGIELGKRARAGEDDAKKHLNNRFSNQIDKYGKKVPMKATPIKKSRISRIIKALKGK